MPIRITKAGIMPPLTDKFITFKCTLCKCEWEATLNECNIDKSIGQFHSCNCPMCYTKNIKEIKYESKSSILG